MKRIIIIQPSICTVYDYSSVIVIFCTGEEVLVSGYGVLAPSQKLRAPLISRGCISRVGAAMLQTTCAVQSGASGGAVLRASNNQLLGIVVGHMRALNADPIPRDWPRLNFAVPVAAIAPAIRSFLSTGGKCH